MRFEGTVAFSTGAGSGIGAVTALVGTALQKPSHSASNGATFVVDGGLTTR